VEGPPGLWSGLSAAVRGLDAERLDWLTAANLVDAFRPRWTAASAADGAEDEDVSGDGPHPLLSDDSDDAAEEQLLQECAGQDERLVGSAAGWQEGGVEVLEWVEQAILRAGRSGLVRGGEWAGGEGGVGWAVARVVRGMAAAGRLEDDALYEALRREVDDMLLYRIFCTVSAIHV
jgi:hypothetical protein